MADRPFGPWSDGPSDPDSVNVLAGTPFGEFADIERAAAVLGFDPEPKEIWEIAAAFGAHRTDDIPQGPEGFVMDSAIQEMIEKQKVFEATGIQPQWGQPNSPDTG